MKGVARTAASWADKSFPRAAAERHCPLAQTDADRDPARLDQDALGDPGNPRERGAGNGDDNRQPARLGCDARGGPGTLRGRRTGCRVVRRPEKEAAAPPRVMLARLRRGPS